MLVKVRSLESVPFFSFFFYIFVMYYMYGAFGSSLLIESTDSMIQVQLVNRQVIIANYMYMYKQHYTLILALFPGLLHPVQN